MVLALRLPSRGRRSPATVVDPAEEEPKMPTTTRTALLDAYRPKKTSRSSRQPPPRRHEPSPPSQTTQEGSSGTDPKDGQRRSSTGRRGSDARRRSHHGRSSPPIVPASAITPAMRAKNARKLHAKLDEEARAAKSKSKSVGTGPTSVMSSKSTFTYYSHAPRRGEVPADWFNYCDAPPSLELSERNVERFNHAKFNQSDAALFNAKASRTGYRNFDRIHPSGRNSGRVEGPLSMSMNDLSDGQRFTEPDATLLDPNEGGMFAHSDVDMGFCQPCAPEEDTTDDPRMARKGPRRRATVDSGGSPRKQVSFRRQLHAQDSNPAEGKGAQNDPSPMHRAQPELARPDPPSRAAPRAHAPHNLRRSNSTGSLLSPPPPSIPSREVLREKNTSPRLQARKRSSSYNNHAHGGYRIGELRRDATHSLPFNSMSQASILVSKLPLNAPVFVKRTSKDWTYAKLMARRQDGDGSTSVVVALDEGNTVKKIIDRSKWASCLRLVNENAIGGGRATDMIDAARNENVPNAQEERNAAQDIGPPPSYLRLNSAPEPSRHARKSVSFHCSAGTPSSNHGERPAFYPPSAAVHAAAYGSTTNPTPIRRTVSLDSIPGRDAADGRPSKCVSFHDRAAVRDERRSETPSPGKRSPSASPPKPGSARTPPGAPTKSSPTGHPMPSSCHSPNTVAVNLHARHFCGSRRDRMRPMQRKNSAPPSLGGLDSLGSPHHSPGGGEEADVSCDATCAPDHAGGGGASGVGGLWNSWSSSFDAATDHAAPPPPYATRASTGWDEAGVGSATLGGGMTMRLRGVDP